MTSCPALRTARLWAEELWLRRFALGSGMRKVEIKVYPARHVAAPSFQQDLLAPAIEESVDERPAVWLLRSRLETVSASGFGKQVAGVGGVRFELVAQLSEIDA